MHELSLAKTVCDTIAAHVPPGHRVMSVTVEIGPLCGVVPDALDYCFSIVAGTYGFEGAKLDLRLLQASATCSACGARFSVQSMWDSCPECRHVPVTVNGGRELRIKEVDVDEIHHV